MSDSGATYNSFVIPFSMSFLTWVTSVLFKEELSTWAIPCSAEMPRMAST